MLLTASSVCGLFKWRQFEPEMIPLAVGWYLRFSLSYRDVEELLAERGLLVDHVTVWRWVQRYAPEIQRRLRPRLRPTNDSWRVDETYIRVRRSVYCTASFLVGSLRPIKLPIIYPRPSARLQSCNTSLMETPLNHFNDQYTRSRLKEDAHRAGKSDQPETWQ